MYQTMEIYMARKKKVQHHFLSNTYRLFDENICDVRYKEGCPSQATMVKKPEKSLQHPRSPYRNNMPHPYYARFLRDNVRFIKDPISLMETADTKHCQAEWWPRSKESTFIHRPSYDRKTTQKNEFPAMVYSSPQTRHGCNPHKTPLHGIVPLASPRDRTKFPKLLQEEMSFTHQYNARLTPNEPIRGKRHGVFVWKEIKTEHKPMVPQGTQLFLNATGSHSLQQPQTEKGSSVESSMTSPNICMHSSQQMFHSETYLSKTDCREAAKTYPRIPSGKLSQFSANQEEDPNSHQ
ncbi:ciliary microtubule inner protein 6 [Pelodytes ibericus]